MLAAVKAVAASEVTNIYRFFQVGPDQPDLHAGFLVSESIGETEENRGAGCAVIRADKSGLEEGVVMSGEDENALLRIESDIELADDVVNRDWSARRGGDEIVGINLRAVFLQDLMD